MSRPFIVILSAFLAACETSPELPTALEGPAPFSRVVFDQTTLSPVPGTALTVGQSLQYRADAFFELSPADLVDNPWKSATILLEAWDVSGGSSYYSEGDWVEAWTALEEGATSGILSISGSITIPATSPDCTQYDEIHLAATLGYTSAPPQQVSDKSPGSGLEARSTYSVVGSVEPTEPCIESQAWVRNYDWGPGDDVTLYLTNIGEEAELSVNFGGGPPATVFDRTDWSDGDAWVDVWIPPGSPSGEVRVIVDGVPAISGGGIPKFYPMANPQWDFADPYNDRGWEAARSLYTNYPDSRIHFWNPALMFSAADREVNPEWNPWGLTDYGVGDWWKFRWSRAGSLCIEMTFAPEDEATFFFTSIGNLVYDEKTVEPGRVWMEIPLLNPPSDGSVGQIELWAAPKQITSELGAYTLAAAACDWPGFQSASAEPASPEGSPLRLPAR